MPFGGYVVNRLHPERPATSEADRQATARALGGELPAAEAEALLERLEASYERERARALRDRALLERLREKARAPLVGVPRLEGDLADVEGLARLVDSAFAAGR